MKVLAVLNSLAPGGTEQSTIALVPALRELGVEVIVVPLRLADNDLEPSALAAGIRIVRLATTTPARQLVELRRLIRSEKPDIVHTALFDADIVGRIAAWFSGTPVVSSFVNTPYDPARLVDPNVTRLKLLAVRALDSVTGHLMVSRFHAVSEGVKTANAHALHLSPGRIEVAERGRSVRTVDDETVRSTVREELGVARDQTLLLNVGRQEHQKGQVELLECLPLLADATREPVLVIAGREGNATNALRGAVEALGDDQRRVQVLGHRSDVPELLAAADVLVISSRYEGTAGVAIEAMASGTPIVSTRLEGLVGVLQDESNSLLVPVGDASALAHAIQRLLDEEGLARRLVGTARRDYEQRFTVEAAAQRMARLYAAVT